MNIFSSALSFCVQREKKFVWNFKNSNLTLFKGILWKMMMLPLLSLNVRWTRIKNCCLLAIFCFLFLRCCYFSLSRMYMNDMQKHSNRFLISLLFTSPATIVQQLWLMYHDIMFFFITILVCCKASFLLRRCSRSDRETRNSRKFDKIESSTNELYFITLCSLIISIAVDCFSLSALN